MQNKHHDQLLVTLLVLRVLKVLVNQALNVLQPYNFMF